MSEDQFGLSSIQMQEFLDKPERKSIKMREFDTGATRDKEDGKFDYEGFLSPLALERYAKYMHEHRTQADGKMRDSDNWQKGIPLLVYMKSCWRHFFVFWKLHRRLEHKDERTGEPVDIEDALCGVIFNAMGYLHELRKITEELPI